MVMSVVTMVELNVEENRQDHVVVNASTTLEAETLPL